MSGFLSNDFAQIAQKAGSLENLLDEFFNFLNTRTDFYITFPKPVEGSTVKYPMGFPEGEAKKMLEKSMNKFPFKSYEKVMQEMNKSSATSNSVQKPSTTTPASVPIPPSSSSSSASSLSSSSSSLSSSNSTTSILRYTDKGKQFPIGNGGIEPKHGYSWTQTLTEVTVYVPLFDLEGLKGKEIDFNLKPSSLTVKIRNKLILEGNFQYNIKVSESIWSLSSSLLTISLWKEKEIWWSSVFQGHEEIDTTKVDSTKSITEYDEVTQGTIRKLVHEERENKLKNHQKRPEYYED